MADRPWIIRRKRVCLCLGRVQGCFSIVIWTQPEGDADPYYTTRFTCLAGSIQFYKADLWISFSSADRQARKMQLRLSENPPY
jgi:hypothetical protein